MTVQELKLALVDKGFPDQVVLNPSAVVSDTKQFLQIQFLECELWTKDIAKCPAYLRLLQFYKAVYPQADQKQESNLEEPLPSLTTEN